MISWKKIDVAWTEELAQKLLGVAATFEVFSILNSNHKMQSLPRHIDYKGYDYLAGFGAKDALRLESNVLDQLQQFIDTHSDSWKFLTLSYDIKNELESLVSQNTNVVDFPLATIFVPQFVVKVQSGVCYIGAELEGELEAFIAQVLEVDHSIKGLISTPSIQKRTTKESYLEQFQHILGHIQRGDVYELNYCQEFYAESIDVDPIFLYARLNQITESPFSAFYKFDAHYLLSSSPERYLLKLGEKLYSQPIKGTIRRGDTVTDDDLLKQALRNNEKEKAENVMIVDLVRNDLSKIAKERSVCVEELFGIYSFPQVHQMISTVSSTLKEGVCFKDILNATFPMGSMTGAPKISAMQLIERYEDFQRGIYSGAVGYIDPDGNFDLNVVIRSVIYNTMKNYLSFSVGSAITIKADATSEYEECLLKATGILKALGIDELEA